VWGNLVCAITPHTYAAASYIRPGDLFQYRNASFKGRVKLKNGGYWTYTFTATHHSSVVESVAQGGHLINVYEQNSGGRLYVTTGYVNFPDMQSGTVFVYRAR
jgi:hypothetical protein